MSLLGTIVSTATGALTGGLPGALVGLASSLGGGGGAGPGTAVAVPSAGPGNIFQNMNNQANSWLQGQGIAPSAGSCPRGYHLNKHPLAATKRHGAVPARSICVRNRSMNPLNPRALTKALKREKRARKLLSRLHVFKSTTRAAPGRGGHRAGCGCVVCKRR